jgi:ATP-dependent protease Clp ATPase subunit
VFAKKNRPKSPKSDQKRPKATKIAQNVAKPVFDRTFSTRAHYVGENLTNLVTLLMTQKHYGLQKARSRFYETEISSQTEPELLSPQKN